MRLCQYPFAKNATKAVRFRDRFLIAFGNTDEIFAVASAKPAELGKKYMFGLILAPFLGWSSGTLIGAAAGALLRTQFAVPSELLYTVCF